MEQTVQCANEAAWGSLKLNRPQALNALNLDMIHQLYACLEDWREQQSIKAVILSTDNLKAYCVGGDIRLLYGNGKDADPAQMQFFKDEYQLNYFMAQYDKPIVALINGMAMGGGIGISLHTSHPIATDKAIFAMPETAIGFFPDIGASYLLSRCPGALGLFLALTGRRFDAFDAYYLGLVKTVIAHDSVSDFIEALSAEDLGTNPADAIDKISEKYSITDNTASEMAKQADAINRIFSVDSLEAIFDGLNNAQDAWSRALLNDLESRSPLSLKITFEQLRRAKHMNLSECLEMDYTLAQHFMQSSDFYEGVRAMVIDKDRKPQWKTTRIADIDKATVRAFFSNR